MTLLIVEDDPDIASLLLRGFAAEGYEAEHTATGEAAIAIALARSYRAIILDVMLPGISGVEVCRRLRARGDTTPIIMLSARDQITDRVEGLEVGADDYVVKPFAFEELLARVRVQARRNEAPRDRIEIAGATLDTTARRIVFGNASRELTTREFALVMCLHRHDGRTVSRAEILADVWKDEPEATANLVDVYIGYLRRKLDDVGLVAANVIRTVRGAGYRLDRHSGGA